MTLTCNVCATEFVPRVKRGSNTQKYCSEKCRDKAYARRLSADPSRRAHRNEKTRAHLAVNPLAKERRRQAVRKYAANHPHMVKASRQKWIANHLEHLAEYARVRRSKDPEKYRQQQRDYYRRLRDTARRGVLAATPKKRGRPPGKRDSGTDTKINVIAYCLDAGMSPYQIATYWNDIAPLGLYAAKTTIDSCIADHGIEIEQRKTVLSGLLEPEREAMSGLSKSQRDLVRGMVAKRRKKQNFLKQR